MSTTTKKNPRTALTMGLALAAVVTISGWLILRDITPGNMATGFLLGGGVVIVFATIALARTIRAPHRTTSVERTVGGVPDERDTAVLRGALATLGAVSLPLTSCAAIALAVGAPVSPVIAILLWSQLATLLIAYAVSARRI